ncbi:MAG: caspase family protein, partial [Deltaproteobacteria bacterium]|nr:caspase family protein [Deltaproteobacteria bacterium]
MCKLCDWLFKPDPDPSPSQPVPDWGDKYALLVGINKYHPSLNCNLQGCVNDVEHLRDILIDQFEFDPDNIRVLTDERATHNNIIDR